jgi:hypothetical protein
MAIKNKMCSCDFCENEITEEDYLKGIGKFSWGQRGVVYPSGPLCALPFEQKHACQKEICKAKLLVWARS